MTTQPQKHNAAVRGLLVLLVLIARARSWNTSSTRRQILRTVIATATPLLALSSPPCLVAALQTPPSPTTSVVAYRNIPLQVNDNLQVPVACWYPSADDPALTSPARYQHRISIQRIGKLLAGWDFIPEFVAQDFELQPTYRGVVEAAETSEGSIKAPVVLLAHGYLGSRFDLSHLAEFLAQSGFCCLAPEYPESLAASYKTDLVDRQIITDKLLASLDSNRIHPTSYSIVGHSLGCGTAISTGTADWNRVLISGFPRRRDGSSLPGKKVLFVSSRNDGVARLSKDGDDGDKFSDYEMLEPSSISNIGKFPARAALILDRPNHISFLSEDTNNVMIQLLSPLLPLAQALEIPVLDFDRYQKSRDSVETAAVVNPIILQYLQQFT